MSVIEVRKEEVLWSGENPIMLLKPDADSKEVTAVGFFRVDYSPQGGGHAAFLITDLTGAGGEQVFTCYTDNLKMAEWIRETTIGTLPEFASYDLSSIPFDLADFESDGDTRVQWTERVHTDHGTVVLTWRDLLPPFLLRVPIGSVESIPYEISTVIYPARQAEVRVFGCLAPGQAFPDEIDGHPHSSAFLALSETWLKA